MSALSAFPSADPSQPFIGPQATPYPAGSSSNDGLILPAFAHPYAPLIRDRKGKARAAPTSASNGSIPSDDEIRAVQSIRQALQAARGIVGKGFGEGGKGRSVSTSRETASMDAMTVPLPTVLANLSLPSPPISPLDPLTNLPPVEALSALSRALSLDAFIEDSQFGLLKTSLSLAGGTCVVDVDLEIDALDGLDGVDAADGADEDDEMGGGSRRPSGLSGGAFGERMGSTGPVTAGSTVPNTPGGATGPWATGSASRGRVRLSKLLLNYQTPSEDSDPGTEGRSDWIAEVLRDKVEAYISAWNDATGRARRRDIAKSLQVVREGLTELKDIDELVKLQGKNWFAELDKTVMDLRRLTLIPTPRLHQGPTKQVFPTFSLLPSGSQSPITLYNPCFRFRPAYQDESVPIPAPPQSALEASTDLLAPGWIMESVVSEQGTGLAARRYWLDDDISHAEQRESWTGPLRVEQVLYDPLNHRFPYLVEHAPPQSATVPPQLTFSMARPGPQAVIVGRVGLPTSQSGIEHILHLARRQVVLNALFCSAFRPSFGSPSEDYDKREPQSAPNDGDTEMGDDLFNMLSGAPESASVTVVLGQNSISVSLPLPSTIAELATLHVELRPAVSDQNGLVTATTRCGPDGALAADAEAKVEQSVVASVASVRKPDLATLVADIRGRLQGA